VPEQSLLTFGLTTHVACFCFVHLQSARAVGVDIIVPITNVMPAAPVRICSMQGIAGEVRRLSGLDCTSGHTPYSSKDTLLKSEV
jgi:hypothetical protein